MFGNSGKSWKLFSVLGHQVHITPWFLVLIAFFSFSGLQAGQGMQAFEQLLIWAPLLFVGILFHEFGHAFAIQAFGYGPSYIELQGFGGVTVNTQRRQASPGRSIVISLAGPLASLLLAAIAGGILLVWQPQAAGFSATFLTYMALINVVWAVFNMLPINPMDGGQVVLHALHWGLKDLRKAMRYSAISSLVVLGAGLALTFALGMGGISFLWILMLCAIFAMQNWRIYQATK